MTMASKEAYQKQFEAQLKVWDARLDVLNARAQKVTADARINYENELAVLKRNRTAAFGTLDELGRRGENAWDEVKVGMERTISELGRSFAKVAARFR
jgi:phage-related tail protein